MIEWPSRLLRLYGRRIARLVRVALRQREALLEIERTARLERLDLVAAHVRLTPHAANFGEFAAANPQLFDRTLPLSYYSESRLMSSAARAGWVEPDLKPLPAITDRSGA